MISNSVYYLLVPHTYTLDKKIACSSLVPYSKTLSMKKLNNMVEVFKTNIGSMEDAQIIKYSFDISFPKFEINFDLSDVDRVLRVKSEAEPINNNVIMRQVRNLGFTIRVMNW